MIMVREEGENYDLKRRQKCKKKVFQLQNTNHTTKETNKYYLQINKYKKIFD